MIHFWIELAGWFGVLSYLVAYLLLTLRILPADTILYHLLNILGAIGLIINSWYTLDHQSITVNAAWLLIGSWAIFRHYWSRPSH